MHGAFTPLFTSIDQLASKSVSVADAGKILPGLVDGQLKHYRVAVDDGEPAPDDAPGRIRPANHHPFANPVIFIQC